MAVKVVVADVVGIVLHVMGTGHVHGAVAENNPHSLGRPGVLAAKGTDHLGGIMRGEGLCVGMSAEAEHVHLSDE